MNLTRNHEVRLQSLALLSGLRIRHCCELWPRPAGTATIRPPSLETSICRRRSLKKKKKKKQKKPDHGKMHSPWKTKQIHLLWPVILTNIKDYYEQHPQEQDDYDPDFNEGKLLCLLFPCFRTNKKALNGIKYFMLS